MRVGGLHLEQAPPLSIPLAFFLTAPWVVASAGAALLWSGSAALSSSWSPLTMAIAHLGTLGFLGMVMLGALYQMTPVVAGSPVPRVRTAHAVHGLLLLGIAGLVCGIARGANAIVLAGVAALALAFLLFLGPVGVALARAPTRNATVAGMRAALGSLLLTVALGAWMALGHAGLGFPGPRPLWIQVHLCVGLFGWVGGLISSVSWQVLPMFYLSPPVSRGVQRTLQISLAVGVLLPVAALAVDASGITDPGAVSANVIAGLAALPAVGAVWGLHPLTTLASLRRRRRRRVDGSLHFWRAGLAIAPVAGLVAVATLLLPGPHWGLLLGWLAVWGWAGTIVHGMLTRIVPFLVWFHRFAPQVGVVEVPSARGLLPDRWTRVGFALHLASVVAGVVAILVGTDALARMTGLLLLATAVSLGHSLLRVALRRPEPAAVTPGG